MTNRLRASSEWARGAGPAFFKHQMFPQRIDCTLGQMAEPMALGMLPVFSCFSTFWSSTFLLPTRTHSVAGRLQGVFS